MIIGEKPPVGPPEEESQFIQIIDQVTGSHMVADWNPLASIGFKRLFSRLNWEPGGDADHRLRLLIKDAILKMKMDLSKDPEGVLEAIIDSYSEELKEIGRMIRDKDSKAVLPDLDAIELYNVLKMMAEISKKH